MNQILTHTITFLTGLAIGIFGNFFANRLSDKAKSRDERKGKNRLFQEIKAKMPDLISEMKEDILNPDMKLCREFFISPSKSIVFNSSKPTFMYYEDEHDNLKSKIRILENNGFVFDITESNTPKYQFDEDFVDRLINDK